jgi:hypothetical protein
MIKVILVICVFTATWFGNIDAVTALRTDGLGDAARPATKGDRLDIRPRDASCGWPSSRVCVVAAGDSNRVDLSGARSGKTSEPHDGPWMSAS